MKKAIKKTSLEKVILEASPNPIVIASKNATIEYINKKGLKILGLKEKDVVGKNIAQVSFLSPKTKLTIAKEITKSLASKKEENAYSIEVKNKKGDILTMELNSRAIQTKRGIEGWVVILKDMTGIRKEKERAEHYLKIAGVIFVGLDNKGNITLVNDKGNEVLGYKEGELIGKNWFTTCLPKKTRTQIKKVFKRIVAGDVAPVEYYENPVLTKTGREIMVRWHNSMVKDREGKITGLLSSGEDITEKEKAQRRLQESEATLNLAQKVGNIGSWTYDPKTKRPKWSRQMYTIFGLNPKEKEKSYNAHKRIIHPDDWKKFDEAVKKAIEKGEEYDLEIRIIRPDKRERWINTKCVVEKKEGDIIRLIGTCQDITERKNAEKKLKESENLLNTSQDIGKTGSWTIDLEKNTLKWSDQTYKIFGIKKGTLLNLEKFLDTVHPGDKEYVSKKWTEAMKGEKYDIVHRITVEGQTKWVREIAKVEFGPRKNAIKATGMVQDITLQKEAQTRTKQTKHMLQRIIDLLPVRIFWKDKNLSYLGCNLAFAKDAGKTSAKDMIGKTDFDMSWKEQAKLYRADDKEVIESHKSKINFEEPQTTPEGKKIWLRTTKIPLLDEEGNLRGILGTYQDITEEKERERELENTAKNLNKFNKFAIGRELTMIELKKEVNSLLKEVGKPEKYKIQHET